MKKSIIAIIVIIILILVIVYVVGKDKFQSYQDKEMPQEQTTTENFVPDVENIDLGNVDQEFQQIDSDLKTL